MLPCPLLFEKTKIKKIIINCWSVVTVYGQPSKRIWAWGELFSVGEATVVTMVESFLILRERKIERVTVNDGFKLGQLLFWSMDCLTYL